MRSEWPITRPSRVAERGGLRRRAEQNGQNWRAAVASTGVDADFFIFRDRSRDTMLPWDVIDGGMKSSFFQSEYEKALREEWTLPPKRQQENARLKRAVADLTLDKTLLKEALSGKF